MLRRFTAGATIALCLVLWPIAALAQVSPGTSPLPGGKGGTGNAFMRFTGPASAIKTFTLPNASGTIGVLNAIATWTAAQSFSDGTLILLGSSSGSSTLKAPATGGGTATLFPGIDTIVGRASTDTLTNKTINCANNVCTVRLANDVTGTLPKANGGLGATTLSSAMSTEFSSTQGSVLYRNASGWVALGPGSPGQLLATGGSGANPGWITASGTGTVTSVTCFGSAITTSGTCATAATKAEQQSAGSATAVVTPSQQQSHPSASKAWVRFSGASGSMSASYNVSSVSRAGAGSYTINFSTAFTSGTAYGCVGAIEDGGTNGIVKSTASSKTASAVGLFAVNLSGSTYDPDNVDVICFGTQ